MDARIKNLCTFLDASHSAFHAQANTAARLDQAGYTRLNEEDCWQLVPGGKYYFTRGNAAVAAFRVPSQAPKGFLISASHTDHPTFKLKENGELVNAYTRLSVERYGGPLMFPWLDRPLSVAGRVMVETENGAEVKLVDIDRDLLLIPNVAIHMNRSVNDGYKWTMAPDMQPLVGSKEAAGKLTALLEEQAGGKILGHDLYLYIRQKASVWGIEEDYISAAALDDLQCVFGCLEGFLAAGESRSVPVFCALNSEEVGSQTPNGAASTILRDCLQRICDAMGWNLRQLLTQSFLVSADNAHAMHPNHPELADANNAPVLGGGLVLKFNASQKYCTDGLCTALMRTVCKKAGVPMQTYYNRPDIPGGSTLGNISLSQVSVPTADIGLPQLAMHSCFETASVSDTLGLCDAMTAYYSSTLEMNESGFTLV